MDCFAHSGRFLSELVLTSLHIGQTDLRIADPLTLNDPNGSERSEELLELLSNKLCVRFDHQMSSSLVEASEHGSQLFRAGLTEVVHRDEVVHFDESDKCRLVNCS